jgi:hypothetical protein
MPPRRRADRDPRQELALVVDRLGGRRQLVTYQDIEDASARASSRLPSEGLADLVEAAVAESMLLKDLRTFFDRKTGAFSERWVYRVNPRHPLVADLLAEADRPIARSRRARP